MNERIAVLREAVVKITQVLADKQITVTQRGTQAYVKADPRTGRPTMVNLPYIPDNADEDLVNAIQGFLDHEVAHCLFSDFKLIGKGVKQGVANMHNLIEDSMIERLMAKKFTGTAHNLSNTAKFFLDTFTEVELKKALEEGNTNRVIGILMVPAVRAWAGQHAYADYMKDKWHHLEGVVKQLGDLIHDVPKCKTTDDTLALALKFKKAMKRPDEPAKGESGTGEGKAKSKESKSEGKSSDAKGEKPSKPDEKDAAGESAGGETPADEPADSDESPADGTDPSSDGRPEDGEADDAGTPDAPSAADPAEDGGGDGDEGGAEDAADAPEDDREGGGSEASDRDRDDAGTDDGAEGGDTDPLDAGSESEGGEMSGSGEGGEGDTECASPKEGDSEGGKEGEVTAGEAVASCPDFEDIDAEMGEDFDTAVSKKLSDATVDASRAAPYLIYTKEDDVIELMPVGYYRDYWLDDLEKETLHLTGPLQKDLERAIAAKSLNAWQQGLRRGRVNAGALARLTIGDDRVFRKKIVHESKDCAVELLVDCSGSMSGDNIRIATEAAYALATVLDRIGISSEVLGFTTCGVKLKRTELESEERKLGRSFSRYEALYMPILKGFGERMLPEVKKRFACVPNALHLANNVDGECLEIAARRLAQRRESNKVLIVLSDGEPAARGDYHAQYHHLERAVQAVEAQGINVVGIGINTKAVEHFYPKHLVINHVGDLPGVVMARLKAMIMPK